MSMDSLTGLIPIVVGSGVVLKVTDASLGGKVKRRRKSKSQSRRRRNARLNRGLNPFGW